MKHKAVLFFLFFYCQLAIGQSIGEEGFLEEYKLQQHIDDDKSINYDLNQIITIVEKSINTEEKVIIPEGVTDFERLLFTARRIQHNDSQLIAIKLFKFMLEFELYRTKGEELYIKLLMSTSLEYIGSRVLAKNYLEDIFPLFLNYLKSTDHKRFFLTHYAGLLMRNKDYVGANRAYKSILQLNVEVEDSIMLLKTRNNYGHTLNLLGKKDSALYYFKENQREIYKHLDPVIYAFSFGNYATILLERRELDSVIFYAQKEITLLKEVPTREGLDYTYKMLGDCYEIMKRIDSSCHYYMKALEVYKLNKNVEGIIETMEKMISIKASNGNDNELKMLIKEHQTYNDSLIESLSTKTYEGDINVFNYLKILDETQLSKKQFDVLETKNRELNYLVLGLAVLLLLLIVIIITRRANRMKLQMANNDLLSKNKALKESYNTISETNAKSELLLKELHHRVKNNLQMIISLFNLQSNAKGVDERSIKMFRVAQDRIFSIALVHKKIYQSGRFTKLNFKEYLEAFIKEIVQNNKEQVKVDIQIEEFDLSIDSAVPLGLIINELFTNSLKHAQPENNLVISIKQTKEEGFSEFIYMDNGQGINLKGGTIDSKNTIGITLIKLLSEQLGAKIEFKEAKKGAYGFWFCIMGDFK